MEILSEKVWVGLKVSCELDFETFYVFECRYHDVWKTGNTLETFFLKSGVLKVNRIQIWSPCRGNENVD